MPYRVEFREEMNTLISYITPESPTAEEIQCYLDEVIRLQSIVIQNQSPRLYHILVLEARRYNLIDGINIIRTIRQSKALNDPRKHLSVMTLLVGQTPRALQIMIAMMTRQNEDGRHQMSVFSTLEMALDFVRTDNLK